MGYSWLFNIPGHTGTDFKNRKAFNKAKETHKNQLYKYADQYDYTNNLDIDYKRMRLAEKRKRRKQIILLSSVLIIAAFSAFIIDQYFFQLDYTVKPALKYKKSATATEALQLDMENIEFLKLGYNAWENKDYESAILWMEQVSDYKENWARKECALFGIYKDLCNNEQKKCNEEKEYSQKVRQIFLAYTKVKEEKIFDWIDNYNSKMMRYMNYNKSDEPIENISFISF